MISAMEIEQARLIGSLLAHLDMAATAMEQAVALMKAEGFARHDYFNLERAAMRARAMVVAEQTKILDTCERARRKTAAREDA